MKSMFKGKKILVGVTGGIAAYKVPDLVRAFRKMGADVQVVQSRNSRNFVTDVVLEAVSGNKVGCEMFGDGRMQHIDFANVDAVVVAPATANFLSKYVQGGAGDLLMTTLLATKAPVVVCPSMNVNMWEHPFVQANVEKLREVGVRVVDPDDGDLACGMVGPGRLPENEIILQNVFAELERERDLEGKRILITAGPTREYADPVRFLSNGSSGRMGVSFAIEAAARGAEVCLVMGPSDEVVFDAVERVDVVSGEDMYREVDKRIEGVDVFVSCAAVCDYRFEDKSDNKIKKSKNNDICLISNVDVLEKICKKKRANQIFIGFALETEFEEEELKRKKRDKCMDYMVANGIEVMKGSGELKFEIYGEEKVEFVGGKVGLARKIFDYLKF